MLNEMKETTQVNVSNIIPFFKLYDKFSIVKCHSVLDLHLLLFISGDEYHVSPGWLIDQSQITLHLHDNPIKLWNRKYGEKNISVKCTPIDHRYRDVSLLNGTGPKLYVVKMCILKYFGLNAKTSNFD